VRFELELSGLAPTVSWTVAGVLVAAGTLPLIALKVNKLGLAPPRLAIHCAGELEALLMVTVCSAGGVPGPPCDAHMLPPSATVLGDTPYRIPVVPLPESENVDDPEKPEQNGAPLAVSIPVAEYIPVLVGLK